MRLERTMEMNDQVEARLEKLRKLREMGINPYPYGFAPTHDSAALLAEKAKLLPAAEGEAPQAGPEVAFAGRIVRYNLKGKLAFVHLKDDAGRMQIMFGRDAVGEPSFELVKILDIGDWIGVRGSMFVTRAGEYTVHARTVELLSKAVRPLPIPKEKIENGVKVVFDEFKDVETRYRQRYVDLTLNDGVRETFKKRSRIIQAIRRYLLDNAYLEVETPILQAIYGGASARPFLTHHNALDIPLYLRVSNELYLKRCITGGFPKVFEFAKDFRNEGIDRTHNPEFTLLEFYQAFADYNDMMKHFENVYAAACIAANGSPRFTYQGEEFDLTPPWPRMTVKQALLEFGGLDVDAMSDGDMMAEMDKAGVELKGKYSRGLAVKALFEAKCEAQLKGPVFIIDHPKESTPLCKGHRSDPDLVEQFEPYINGWEVGNAYSELNDPLLQRKLLEEQVERGRGGEDETHPLDEDFLRALEYGMPPTGGVGIGIDRMVMLLTDSATIKDVLLFPLMKPE
ncbi:MAG TPA: lysine--tRNA ligase [Fibrobacteria bacterium]|nr:lysine--tRNA ligase [Fibrobacteria bacterium]